MHLKPHTLPTGLIAQYIKLPVVAHEFSTNDRVSRHFREAVDHAAGVHELSGAAGDRPFKRLSLEPDEIDLDTLRHSACTYWLRQKRRLIWVNHLMRHREIETTMKYVHLLPTHLREMNRDISGEQAAA